MGSIVINGTTVNDVTQAFPAGQGYPTAGNYYPLGEPADWGEPPCFGPYISDRREVAFTGVDWTAEKDGGKRKRMFFINVIVFATLANLRSNVQTLIDGFATNTRYTITINGKSFAGCKLAQDLCGRGHRIPFGNSMVGEVLPLVFKQLSDTN